MDTSDLPNPIEYFRDMKNERQRKKEFRAFYTEQFQKMVENGNVEKAVELIWDEANNLDVRLDKEVMPETLAHYCREQCDEVIEDEEIESEHFKKAVAELDKRYELEEYQKEED